MFYKVLVTVTFGLAAWAVLSFAGILAGQFTFIDSSGWRDGFAVMFAIVSGIVSLMAALLFTMSSSVFRIRVAAGEAALLALAASAVASAVAAMLFFISVPGILTLGIFYGLFFVGAFGAPFLVRFYHSRRMAYRDSRDVSQ